jgi:hypothetical protein
MSPLSSLYVHDFSMRSVCTYQQHSSTTNIFLFTTMQHFPPNFTGRVCAERAAAYSPSKQRTTFYASCASSDDPFVFVSALAALPCGASLSPDELNAPDLFVPVVGSPSPAVGLILRAFGGSSGCSHCVLRVSWSMYTYCQIRDSGVSKRRAVNNHHTVSAQFAYPP